MLKADVGEKKIRSIEAQGSTKEITVDLLAVIHELYSNTRQHNPEAAEAMRRILILAVTDPGGIVFDGNPSPGISYFQETPLERDEKDGR